MDKNQVEDLIFSSCFMATTKFDSSSASPLFDFSGLVVLLFKSNPYAFVILLNKLLVRISNEFFLFYFFVRIILRSNSFS